MNDPTEAKESTVDKHFSRVRVVISAIAVAVTVGASVANVVDRFQRDLVDLHLEHQRDIGEVRATMRGNENTLTERGVRISNLEQQVYDLRHNPTARKDPFTGTEGRELKQRLEQLEMLELKEHKSPVVKP